MMSRVLTRMKAICVALAIVVALPTVASAVCVSQQEARQFVNSGQAIPLSQALRRIGVASVMERSLAQVGSRVSRERARELLKAGPRYLLIGIDSEEKAVLVMCRRGVRLFVILKTDRRP